MTRVGDLASDRLVLSSREVACGGLWVLNNRELIEDRLQSFRVRAYAVGYDSLYTCKALPHKTAYAFYPVLSDYITSSSSLIPANSIALLYHMTLSPSTLREQQSSQRMVSSVNTSFPMLRSRRQSPDGGHNLLHPSILPNQSYCLAATKLI